ncbi:MAG: RNB domain-containing ribonuclease [Chloroflexota bacterium]
MRRRIARADGARLAPAFAAIRAEAGVVEAFPDAALAEAEAAAARVASDETGGRGGARTDLTAIPFVTLDPAGSMDLDQAFHLDALADGGFRVRYAIADVGAFLAPGGALETAAAARITTIYCPDERVPLYPLGLSEGAASLLPDGVRPAVAWTIDIASTGETTAVHVERAWVRSRAKLDYAGVQHALHRGTAEGSVALLPVVGGILEAAEQARGGMSLRVPEQRVEEDEDGRLTLAFRTTLPVEDWNAQLSLLTGRAAARLMLDARVGLLRTMPPAADADVQRLRRIAHGLQIDWPADQPYGALVATMRPTGPRHAAFLNEASALFRGAGYTAFQGTLPPLTTHAAIAAPYAHCTAPLRRLADRHVSEACLAIAAGRPVLEVTAAALPLLPAAMAEGVRRAGHVERGCIDLVEIAVLAPHVGARFAAVVTGVDDDGEGGEVVLPDLAVVARCSGRLRLGHRTQVVLETADPVERRLRLRLAGDGDGGPGGGGRAGHAGTEVVA